MVKRAKIDYIRRLNRRSNEISIEDEQLTDKLIYEPSSEIEGPETCFEFDNRTLSAAFKKSAPKRRRLLELLFIHNMTPDDVAVELRCSLQHVYNLRSLTLKELKSRLNEEDIWGTTNKRINKVYFFRKSRKLN